MVGADVRARLLEAAEPQREELSPPAAAGVPEHVRAAGQPWVTRIEPDRGPVSGGSEVRLDGAAFDPEVRVLFDGQPALIVTSTATSIVARTPERRPAAMVDLRVVNPDGLEHLMIQAFAYDGPPLVAAIDPGHAPACGGAQARLLGAGFRKGARLRLGAAEVACHFCDETRLEFVVPPHPEGPVDAEVANPDGQRAALPQAFRFDGPPIVESLQPDHGPATGCRVTLSGRNFSPETYVVLLPERLVNVSFADAGRLAVDLPARPAAGAVELEVVNADGQRARVRFLYDALPPPRVDAVAPTESPVGGGGSVTLRGAHFDPAAMVYFGGLPATVVRRSSEQLEVTVPAAARPGAVDVTVVNCDESSARLAQAFVYADLRDNVEVARIAVNAVVPDRGPSVGGTRVVVRGLGFTPDARVLLGGERAASQRFLDEGAIEIVTHPAHSPGAIDVQVVGRNGEARLAGGYHYEASPAPRISSVVPNRLGAAGGDNVTLLGQGFAPSARVFIAGQAAKVRFVDASTLDVIAPPGARGSLADVEVRHPDGQRAVKQRACMYS